MSGTLAGPSNRAWQVWSKACQKAGDLAKLGSFTHQMTCEGLVYSDHVMRKESGTIVMDNIYLVLITIKLTGDRRLI